jgi:hypothetical protein
LTDFRWDYESNVKYAQTAENVGFEYALTQIRFMAGYGAVSRPSLAMLHHVLMVVAIRKISTSLSHSPKLSYTIPRSLSFWQRSFQGLGIPLLQLSKLLALITIPREESQSTWSRGGSRQSSPALDSGG